MNEIIMMDEKIKAGGRQNGFLTMSCNEALTGNRYIVRYEVRCDICYVEKQGNCSCIKHAGVLLVW
jgi:hypothetical protein